MSSKIKFPSNQDDARRTTGIHPIVETVIVTHKLIQVTTQTLEEAKNLTLRMRT